MHIHTERLGIRSWFIVATTFTHRNGLQTLNLYTKNLGDLTEYNKGRETAKNKNIPCVPFFLSFLATH